ncbi:MAG TPA: prolyl oligopeptidase family serine peptidase [Pseudoduganella sp.]
MPGFPMRAAMLFYGLATALQTAAAPVPIRDFVDQDSIVRPVLSPDGKYLAVSTRVRQFLSTYSAVTILSLPDMHAKVAIRLDQYEIPASYVWASNRRLIIRTAKEKTWMEAPVSTGEVMATDIDGSNQQYLYGRRRRAGYDYGFAADVALPEQLDGTIYLTEFTPRQHSILYQLDSRNGGRRELVDLNMPAMHFLQDRSGVPRLAYKLGADGKLVMRRPAGDGWVPAALDGSGDEIRVLGVSPAAAGFYALRGVDGAPVALYEQPFEGGPGRVLAQDAQADIGLVMWSQKGDRPFAYATQLGVPAVRYLDESLPEAQLHRQLSAQFPGQMVRLLNASSDGRLWLFDVRSDRDPGSTYLYDSASARADLLVTRLARIDPATMAPRRSVSFTARDGMVLHGYLTVPAGVARPPLVLLPHGGPHGVADRWEFDVDAAFLASRGYAVLQLNFRGSGGRGMDFVKAGYREWGGRIVDDLIDGVRWTLAQGLADPQRVCAYGSSFGAYAAMMVAVRAPGLLRCAAGNAGIYDLPLLLKEEKDASGERLLKEYVGTSEDEQKRNSPSFLAAQVKVPVFLAHGKSDETAPLLQARAMRTALRDAGNEPEYWEVSSEGHGFYNPDNRADFYERLERFLARHLR